jgi:hypothetical protein
MVILNEDILKTISEQYNQYNEDGELIEIIDETHPQCYECKYFIPESKLRIGLKLNQCWLLDNINKSENNCEDFKILTFDRDFNFS